MSHPTPLNAADRSNPILKPTATAVLRAMQAEPNLSLDYSGLLTRLRKKPTSRPTIVEAVQELAKLGLARFAGHGTSLMGQTTNLYRLTDAAKSHRSPPAPVSRPRKQQSDLPLYALDALTRMRGASETYPLVTTYDLIGPLQAPMDRERAKKTLETLRRRGYVVVTGTKTSPHHRQAAAYKLTGRLHASENAGSDDDAPD